jgi:trehalose/maltose hydrolase-like predicted phosphorylase
LNRELVSQLQSKQITKQRGREIVMQDLLAKLGVNFTDDPRWLVVESGYNSMREHEVETILTIGNGYLGTRGSLEEGSVSGKPSTLVAGYFDPKEGVKDVPALVIVPDWLHTVVTLDGTPIRFENGELLEQRRWLDLRNAVGVREWRYRDSLGRITRITTLRFASLEDPHALGLRIIVKPENYSSRLKIVSGLDGKVVSRGRRASEGAARLDEVEGRPLEKGGVSLEMITHSSQLRCALASKTVVSPESARVSAQISSEWSPNLVAEHLEFDALLGQVYIFDKFVSIFTERDLGEPAAEAIAHLEQISTRGFTDLLNNHQQLWHKRWDQCDVVIEGDDRAQQAIRFCLYHLLISCNPADDRVSIGARTLSGPSYNGHIFWDTETFMLPFFTFVLPEAARAMLNYRFRTLGGALKKAQEMGYSGALFAWESAVTGEETTPLFVLGPEGEQLPVYSGIEQHHITADVAFAIWQYWEVSGDEDFILNSGAEILLQAARFWASRAESDQSGNYHINRIMGPDEYHHSINDSVFTNYMARWTIERGEETLNWLRSKHPDRCDELIARLKITGEELQKWRAVAAGLLINYDIKKKLFEQFEGFYSLEYVDLKGYEPRVVPMDVILGQEPIRKTQVIKQPDVIMLFHLFPEAFEIEVKRNNFYYYDSRCGHGSSLGPAICASVAAQIGDIKRALSYFLIASSIDLENNMGNASGGVHAAACGGLWQAVIFGFAGLKLETGYISFDPHLPPNWELLRFNINWRGNLLNVEIGHERVQIQLREGSGEVVIGVMDEKPRSLSAGQVYEKRLKKESVDSGLVMPELEIDLLKQAH